jgi:hypothetical protein
MVSMGGQAMSKSIRAKSLAATATVGAIVVATLATFGPADARYIPYYPYPAGYFMYLPFPFAIADYAAPTYYYGGFYGPRVVFAPGLHRMRYGYIVHYRNIPRY